jgi:uncharacterized membrane protein required for colicin V production
MAYNIYPILAKYIRASSWYTGFKKSIAVTLNIGGKANDLTLSAQTAFINSLNLPKFIKSSLIENNNSEVYNVLGISRIEDYISGYIANMCVNIIALIATFIVVSILIAAIAFFLDIAAKLPGLKSINEAAGAVLGVVKGVLIIWILCIIATFFYAKPNFQPLFLAIENSVIAKAFYENNWIMFMVTKIFA